VRETDHGLEALGSGRPVEKAGDHGRGELIGVIDAIEAAVAILGKDLGKVEVRLRRIEKRNPGLILVRNVHVIESRFQGLDEGIVEQTGFALEDHAGVEREDRQEAHRDDEQRAEQTRRNFARCVQHEIRLARHRRAVLQERGARRRDVLVRVLDQHDAAVDHDADREREATERHDVGVDAEQRHQQHGDEQADR
jgi:hypothetical protein